VQTLSSDVSATKPVKKRLEVEPTAAKSVPSAQVDESVDYQCDQ
jgi:hypothetical protein